MVIKPNRVNAYANRVQVQTEQGPPRKYYEGTLVYDSGARDYLSRLRIKYARPQDNYLARLLQRE